MKHGNKTRILLVLTAALLLAGCETRITPKETQMPVQTPPPVETQAPASAEPNAVVPKLVLDYLSGPEGFASPVYQAGTEPADPQEDSVRVDCLTYAGETPVEGGTAVAYEMTYSRYAFTRDEDLNENWSWQSYDSCYVVWARSADGEEITVVGRNDGIDPEQPVEDAIREIVYGLEDVEVSLRLVGGERLMGPGSVPEFLEEEPVVEELEDWEPIYWENDGWLRYAYTDLTADCYYHSAEDRASVHHVTTTRTDVETYRGIRVGTSLDEVRAAYPELRDDLYWDTEGDYLWYCANEGGFGAAILFWLEDGAVTRIELANMFD